jgi:hypothetical protein
MDSDKEDKDKAAAPKNRHLFGHGTIFGAKRSSKKNLVIQGCFSNSSNQKIRVAPRNIKGAPEVTDDSLEEVSGSGLGVQEQARGTGRRRPE